MTESNTWSININIIVSFGEYAPEAIRGLQPEKATVSKLSLAEISPWTNRVPLHEPWPRVLKQDKGDADLLNKENEGYKNNVDWIDQFDNVTKPDGREPIGKVEGDQKTERGPLWRR